MPDPTPLSGDKLIQECARRIAQRDGNLQQIEVHKRGIETCQKRVEQFQADIDAMQTAIAAGKPWTPPKA